MTGYNRVFLDTTPLIYFLDDDERFGEKTVVSSVSTCAGYLVCPCRTCNQQKIDTFFEFAEDCGMGLFEVNTEIAKKSAATIGISRPWIPSNWPSPSAPAAIRS